jgi:hypothetical protein
MTTQLTAIDRTEDVMCIASLHNVVESLISSLAPAAICHKSYIINDVPVEIRTEVNEDLLASVLGSLINAVLRNSQTNCIRITAKFYGNVVLLHIKDNGCINYSSISQNLAAIQPQVEKLNGFIGLTSYRNKLTTIAFSFVNMHKVS